MNLILCDAQNVHSNSINHDPAFRQSKTTILMKNKQEAMNHHSDGGGGDLDDLSDDPSSPESDNFDDSDLLSSTVHDEVTAQLAAAGKHARPTTHTGFDRAAQLLTICFSLFVCLCAPRPSRNRCSSCHCYG